MRTAETIEEDAQALALSALVWTLGEPARADRFLALTGMDSEDMRDRLTDPAMLDGVLAFLEAHEPDLIACAQTLGVKPERLVAARARLGG